MIEVLIVATVFMHVIGRYLSVDSKSKGRRGERRVRRRLSRLCRRGEYRLLNDIFIKACGVESQIDHIMIGKSGIFVIETKTYQGIIEGGENDQEWIQVTESSESTFYNPVRQNRSHIRALRNLLDGLCPDYCYHSIVVFPSDTCLSVETDKAIGLADLQARIESYRYDSLSAEQMDDIASIIDKAVDCH